MTHPRTPERDAEFIRRWNDGEPMHSIAKAMTMGKSAAYDLRESLKLGIRAVGKNVWSPSELDDVKERWAKGESAATIARAHPNRTRAAVIGIVHRNGWQHLGRGEMAARATMKAPTVRKAGANPRGAHRTAPRPGPQKQTPVVFGYVQATTHAEAEVKREQAAIAGAQHIRGFHFPANDDAIPLVERRFGQCSWPVGEPERPAEQLCCGQPVVGERTKSTATYCDRHRILAAPAGVPLVRTLIRSVRRAA